MDEFIHLFFSRHESPIIRHLAATYMQKSMMAAVTQCEMYHVNLILHQSRRFQEEFFRE